MNKTIYFVVSSLIMASILCACLGSTPQEINAGIDKCAGFFANIPFVQKEAEKAGITPLEFAKHGCQTGYLVGTTIEILLEKSKATREICPVNQAPAVAGSGGGEG